MRWFLTIIAAIATACTPQQDQPEENLYTAREVDALIRDTTSWLRELQAIIEAISQGPLDASETVFLIERFNADDINFRDARAEFGVIIEHQRADLETLRERFSSISPPENIPNENLRELGERATQSVEGMFVHSETLLNLQEAIFAGLTDKYTDISDLVVAEFESRRLLLRHMIGYNENIRLASPPGHPQEYLLGAHNGAIQGLIAVINYEESLFTKGFPGRRQPLVLELRRQADRISRYSGAGRNSIQPSVTRAREMVDAAPGVETAALIPGMLETFGSSFDRTDELVLLLTDFANEIERVGSEDAVWVAVDTFYLDYVVIEDAILTLQNERSQSLLGE